MKKTMYVLIVLLCTLPVQAQSPEQILREVLGLDEAQFAAVHQLLESRRAAIEPLAMRIHQAEAQLAALINSESPDPCAIGTLVQAVHSLRRQIEQHQENFRQGLGEILSEEQRNRLHFIFSVEGALKAAGALHQIGL